MIQIKKVISFMMMLCVLVSIFVSLSCEILQPEEDEITSTDGYETDFTLTSGQTGKGYLNIDETHNWTFSAN